MDEYVATTEAAKRSGIPAATLRQWVKRGILIPAHTTARGHWFDMDRVFDAKHRISHNNAKYWPMRQVDIGSRDLDALITGPEAARLYGLSPSTVRMWVKRGHVTPAKPGPRPLFRVQDILRAAHRKR
ncbi:hypothetical protein GCM10011492_06600 [Flexivirga endophytica]|uniref:Helix-turn-helix domain-containing protein n=1 Tax=Flexivirga endophytica TaxID=1849103 RepID=A0A916SY19_9MICO|nr:MerR family DNA-binding transcriptional regulator [Flexivirga endophytica]GGB19452.1 hypothetical protein GCM10011492_06600 [Flexivirga endophytica]GHB36260.1 hypothetical protein GCM10008112_01010 [Flexivirga endophytica]